MNPFSFDIILNNNTTQPTNQPSLPPTNPASTINEAIGICYNTKQYTDLLLISRNNISIPVHKIIICPQCTYISNALKTPWAKTKSNDAGEEIAYIDFSDEPIEAVKQMVEFFYKGNYTDTLIDPSKASDPSFHYGIDRIREHVEIYVLATKYLIPPLAAKAVKKIGGLQHDFPKSVAKSPALVELVRYIYDNTVDGEEVWRVVAGLAGKYVKHILESPNEMGINVFSLALGEGPGYIYSSEISSPYREAGEEIIEEYIDAIAEKDEGIAEVMLLYPDFGKEVVNVLRRNLRAPVGDYLYFSDERRYGSDGFYQSRPVKQDDILRPIRGLHATFGSGQSITSSPAVGSTVPPGLFGRTSLSGPVPPVAPQPPPWPQPSRYTPMAPTGLFGQMLPPTALQDTPTISPRNAPKAPRDPTILRRRSSMLPDPAVRRVQGRSSQVLRAATIDALQRREQEVSLAQAAAVPIPHRDSDSESGSGSGSGSVDTE